MYGEHAFTACPRHRLHRICGWAAGAAASVLRARVRVLGRSLAKLQSRPVGNPPFFWKWPRLM